jgi:hypothetical protein
MRFEDSCYYWFDNNKLVLGFTFSVWNNNKSICLDACKVVI